MTFLEILSENIRREEQQLKEIRREMFTLPAGNLVRRKRANCYEYYLSLNGSEVYLKKEQWAIANDLKRRKILEKAESALQKNLTKQYSLRNSYNEIDFEQIQSELPEKYRHFEFAPPLDNAGAQIAEPDGEQFFRQSENEYKRGELVNSTYFGLKTRSKSEAMIAETLYRNRFSLYYEKRLFLVDAYGNPRTVYPDFTIPIGRNHVVYWEHKGLLDDNEYLLRDTEKTRLYHINEIYQPRNLIVTAERPGGGLDNEYVEYLVCGFLAEIRKSLSE